MMTLPEIKSNLDLLNAIDWNLTPEEAVRLYLEWGNNWAGGHYVIKGKEDVAHYFVVNAWKNPPVITLIRRNSEEAIEMAEIMMPKAIEDGFRNIHGDCKGVYAVEGEVKTWLQSQLQ